MPYADSNGIRIYYEVEGQGVPLMLMHGFAGSLDSWHNYGYTRELRKDYRLIMLDARGHGGSDKPHEVAAYRPDLFTNDVVAILDDLKLEKVHYFGYSQGAAVGFKSIARYAISRFHSLILGGMSPYGITAEAEKRWSRALTETMQTAAEQGMSAFIAFFEKLSGPMLPGERALYLKNDPWALLAMRKAYAEWPGAFTAAVAIFGRED
ncbi:MAG: alpha/beta fold hydrolase [Dehalococcoidia bacterium]|nr:alpha/beta fold hydrolase [Dehalococcoidia bacterium]